MIIRDSSGSVLWESADVSLSPAVVAAVRAGVSLRRAVLCRADLSPSYLPGIGFSEADLRGADLWSADLREADLHGADLRGAMLRKADLRGADLGGAMLLGADLRGVNLRGARIEWNSHDLVAELLRRAAGFDRARRQVAGLVLISRDWCWHHFLRIDRPRSRAWALRVLAPYVRDQDNAPPALRRAAAALRDGDGRAAPGAGGEAAGGGR